MVYKAMEDVRVLVVDNDIDSRYLWTVLLGDYGFNVTAFASIKDALAFLNDFHPDILICEIRFLGESVELLIERVKHIAAGHGRTIPIMVTSTYSFENLAQYFQHLMTEIEVYLLKPIDIDDFIDMALKLLPLPENSIYLNPIEARKVAC
ncbi:MAG: response regulator [Elainellaceae cyanobacterium]